MLSKKFSFSSSLIVGLVFSISAFNVVADGPVKSVDEQGNVTYSDKPVPGAAVVSKVPIVAGPSDVEVDAAKQQADKNINAAKKIDKKNKAELEKQQAQRAKNKTASESGQAQTGINTPTGNYNGSSPYYYQPPHRPRPPIHRPKPRPPGSKPPVKPARPVNLPAGPRGAR